MTRTRKNLKTVCVKFFGKIGRTLVADSFKVNLSIRRIAICNEKLAPE